MANGGLEYNAKGNHCKVWRTTAPVVLVEGAGNTGKSFNLLWLLVYRACKYPGYKAWIGAETRRQITDSVLATLENKILNQGELGRYALKGAARTNRHEYRFPKCPKTGKYSEIVTGGLNEPSRLYGSEWDDVYVCEIVPNVTYDQVQQFHRAMRNKHVPHPDGPDPVTGEARFQHQIFLDCNPGVPTFWANVLANEGKIERIRTTHRDNPAFTPQDQQRLDLLTGVRRLRLRDGLWCAAEGLVWEGFNPNLHVVDDVPRTRSGEPAFRMYVMAMDWGHRAPACMQLWGVTGDGVMYLVHEHYRAEMGIDWWVYQAVEFNRAWHPVACVCDPEDAQNIDLFHRAGIPTVEADKRNKLASLDQVRDRLRVGRNGKAGLYLVRDALIERDRNLKERFQPCCTAEEIPGYVMREVKEGRAVDEETDPACPDHGCDALRYAVRYVDAYFPSKSIVRSDHLDNVESARGPDDVPEELLILERGSARDQGAAPIRWPWN